MSYQPKVSIIATFYNSVTLGDFVNKTMKSLLNQTYKNIELICVHDGSPDETLLQLKSYQQKDKRIIIIDKANEGTAQYAKAAGQDVASGDFVMLFDHDDSLSYNAIEEAVKTFEKYPELDMVGFIVKVCYDNGNVRAIYNLDNIISNISEYTYHSISGMDALKKTIGIYEFYFRGLYRKHIFKKVSFRFTQKLLNADEIVERQILEHVNKIGSCDGVYTHYIFHNSSAKSFNLKKTDILVTDMFLRNYFKKLGYYEERKSIFEKTAFKNFVMGLKTYFYFKDKLNKEEQTKHETRLKASYDTLDKKTIISTFKGASKIYNGLLISSFPIIYNYYKWKK